MSRPASRCGRPLRRVVVLVSCLVLLGALVWCWPGPVRAAGPRSGDAGLLSAIGGTDGFHRLSVAVVELDGTPRVRYASVGADEHTRYEAGSVTKALTGLVIADEVRRGELDLATPAGRLLPLGDGPASAVTLRQLVTHSSGLPSLDPGTARTGGALALLGLDPYRAVDADELFAAAATTPTGDPAYAYSNLGAALAGQAAARAAGTTYPELLRSRLVEPLGLRETRLQTEDALVPSGRSERGRRMQPWVNRGYAPAGCVVTTTADLATVATALLERRAPGMAALEPLAPAGTTPGRRSGIFWQTSVHDGTTVTWHNGRTGGYSAFLGLDRAGGRGVVVLADAATDRTDDLGMRLVTQS